MPLHVSNPPIIRRSTKQIVHMQPLVSSLSASNRLVQPLRKESIRRSTKKMVHMQPLVSSLSASDCLVQPLRKESFLNGCTRRSLAESDDTRGCMCTVCVVDLLMMGGLRSKHVEEFNFM